MSRIQTAACIASHLAAVGCVGCAFTAVQFQAFLLAAFAGNLAVLAAVLVIVMLIAVGLLAGYAGTAGRCVPLTRRARGRWVWAAVVHACGTAGVVGAVALKPFSTEPGGSLLLYPWGGACYALAATLFLPGARTRLTALGVTAALAAGITCASWSAAQPHPPTLEEWLSGHDVDRTLLRVGEPPSGYTLHVDGAGMSQFDADYRRPGSPGLRLTVERSGPGGQRTDWHGCPVPVGETVHCADDGDGRRLVTHHGGGTERQELRLLRAGLVHIVPLPDSAAERPAVLPAARHILATLRPATEAELAELLSTRSRS